jgi:hypothetical protein
MFMTRRVVLLAAAMAAAVFAAPADTKPDFSGEWKLNVEKSNFGPMPGPDSEVRTIVHKDPDLSVKSVRSGGPMGDATVEMKFTTDGKECVNTIKTPNGDLEIKSTLGWDGQNLTNNSKLAVQGMDITSKEKWELSEDGKVLTISQNISTPQGDFETSSVFDKAASAGTK